jgi:3'-5' exoribonuclease
VKHVKISDLQPGSSVSSVYLVAVVEKKQKKSGDLYAAVTFQDASGRIAAVMWDNAHNFLADKIVKDDFALVTGDVGIYNNQLQLTIRSVEKVDESRVSLADFIPHSPHSIPDMQAQLQQYVQMVTDPHLVRLLKHFFDDSAFLAAFSRAPSACTMHQAYIGGLLEHTLGVARNCLTIAGNYSSANRDLLITGALLHDIGKIEEFTFARAFSYTDSGRLLGHITIGIEMVTNALSQIPDFPAQTKTLLFHMLISHHGVKEWGSPRRPKTLEALILHYADYIDAYLSTYIEVTGKAKERGDLWSDWNKMFERYLFAGFSEEEPPKSESRGDD